MFTLMPSAVAASMAGNPAVVAGILTKMFGLSTADHSSRARRKVASPSSASAGSTSIEARPSAPSAPSYTDRSRSAASRMSSTAMAS